MSRLIELGWDDVWDTQFQAMALEGETPARVSLEHNHVFRVLDAEGEHLAEVSGRIRHEATSRAEMPAVGDWVIMRPAHAEGARPQIRAVMPRRSVFSRKSAGRETEEQVVAANIDTVFLVSGLDQDFNARRIERYLVMARQSGAQPVIVLNKADLPVHVNRVIAEIAAIAPNVPVHAVTAKGPSVDCSALSAYLSAGRTVALLGSSGVGKSTIINTLAGNDLLKTAAVRDSDGRGRHTSVHRHLILLDTGGVVIDTPGMREIQLWDAAEAVVESFPEIDAKAADCRFRDCRHDTEPGCAVKAAVADGTVDASRYESFIKLQKERDAFAIRQEERGHIEQKRQGKVLGKALKAMQKDRGR
ncbi:MAG: ribosome small subunit-dependent GTPase A [Acidobacteria bacterium]|nr:ribosome small subunit-dependent GTPase A [Acidobacteriota bacterium]MBP8274694.1 ribosome small subunit-dependent GTPase A [Acidobacteriota bacterium]